MNVSHHFQQHFSKVVAVIYLMVETRVLLKKNVHRVRVELATLVVIDTV
jgi:hypothetical protein